MSSRAARTDARNAARAKAKRERDRLEKLRLQVDEWVGEKIHNCIASNENLLAELTARIEAKENHTAKEYSKLKETIDTLTAGLDGRVQDIAVPIALRTCRMEMEISYSDSQKKLSDQLEVLTTKVAECREGQAKLRQDLEGFQYSAGVRFAQLEQTATDQRDAKATLQKLEVEFQGYLNEEDKRDAYAHRLEVIVKDLEERTWPWRVRMDRSGSPNGRGMERSPSPTQGEDLADGCNEQLRPHEISRWRPWPTNGPVKPTAPLARGPSRPSSARQHRPVSQDPLQSFNFNPKHSRSTNSVASAGSGMAAARVRPPSASSARDDPRGAPSH
eukprot:gb/GFBE01001565.1/.p1 GENE.gb/GFBE01001565.1/~~gb/GFBE01001565.1/.p1  ORF type:complete len:331 (+),score=48.11 gb/GFBE01001565.1/:1-993(+)